MSQDKTVHAGSQLVHVQKALMACKGVTDEEISNYMTRDGRSFNRAFHPKKAVSFAVEGDETNGQSLHNHVASKESVLLPIPTKKSKIKDTKHGLSKRNGFRISEKPHFASEEELSGGSETKEHDNDESKVRQVRLPDNSLFKKAAAAGTCSSKLSYLISRVLELHRTEKIIIFYEFDDIAYYIAEGLEIARVSHCFYTTSLEPASRAESLRLFTNTSKFSVMLMDLRLAAHGLNVSVASRVFFVNPVWQPNIEAQAMRRAHRIGQTRTVGIIPYSTEYFILISFCFMIGTCRDVGSARNN